MPHCHRKREKQTEVVERLSVGSVDYKQNADGIASTPVAKGSTDAESSRRSKHVIRKGEGKE